MSAFNFAPIMTAQAATNETLADDTLYYETVIEETASFLLWHQIRQKQRLATKQLIVRMLMVQFSGL